MKNIILLFLLSAICITNAQEGGKSNVELPDFVITGKDQISFPPAKKIKPGIISTLSEEFINPPYSPDEFSTGDISSPEKIINIKKDTSEVFNGYINTGFGNIVVPYISAGTAIYSGEFLFAPAIEILSVRDYEPALGFRKTDFSLRSLYTPVITSGFFTGFFTGLRTGLKTGYFSDSRKLFTNPDSFENRNLNHFNADLSFGIGETGSTKFAGGAAFSYSKIGEFDFTENTTALYTSIKQDAGNFSLGGNFTYLNDNYYDKNYNSFMTDAGVEFTVPGKFSMALGAGYTRLFEETGMSTAASFALGMGDGLSLSLQYHNRLSPQNRSDILRRNSYAVPDSNLSLVQKELNHLRIGTKYEFKQYFEVSLFVQVGEIRDYNYFQRDSLSGIFRNYRTDVTKLDFGVDAKFHNGPMGYFYGNLTLSSWQDSLENEIPYVPMISVSGLYGYTFGRYVTAEVGAEIKTGVYQRAGYDGKTKSLVNLSSRVLYNFEHVIKNFSLYLKADNLLNNTFDYWQGYGMPPLSIAAGFEMKF